MRADPAGRTVYERNARAYAGRLQALDREVAACLRRVPAAQRRLVTTHDALGPFAQRYDIEVIGSVLDSRLDPGPALERRRSPSWSSRCGRATSASCSPRPWSRRAWSGRSRARPARVGAPLYADTLGPEGSDGDTYVRSVAANADAMVRGFTAGRERCTPADAAR